MDGGKIVADGTHAELMETVPLYADVLAQSEEELELKAKEARAAEARRGEPTGPGGLGGRVPGVNGIDQGGLV
jgi:hypothetical protein